MRQATGSQSEMLRMAWTSLLLAAACVGADPCAPSDPVRPGVVYDFNPLHIAGMFNGTVEKTGWVAHFTMCETTPLDGCATPGFTALAWEEAMAGV